MNRTGIAAIDDFAADPPVEPEQRFRAKAKSDPTAPPVPILSSSQFIAGFTPPDYLVDGILQRGYFYSLTAKPSGGKTAIVLLTAAHVGLGRFFGSREVQQGNARILCGENPDDVRMRWIAMGEEASFDAHTIPVRFMAGIFDVAAQREQIEREATALGGVAFVAVDTAPAYFTGDDENSNVQMGAHARKLRTLTTLPGRPTVIANCHPKLGATADSLIPRDGSAFLAEVDGNLTCVRDDRIVHLHYAAKIRGLDFDPVAFELNTIRTPRLVDSKGRQLPTVMARLTDADRGAQPRGREAQG